MLSPESSILGRCEEGIIFSKDDFRGRGRLEHTYRRVGWKRQKGIINIADAPGPTPTSIETGTYTLCNLIITPTLTGGPIPAIANGYLDMKNCGC